MNSVFTMPRVGPYSSNDLLDHGFVFFLGFGQAMGKLLILLARYIANRFLYQLLLSIELSRRYTLQIASKYFFNSRLESPEAFFAAFKAFLHNSTCFLAE